jgi:PAS domain S-box-containing protein
MSDSASTPATVRVHDLTLLLEEAQQALAAIRSGEVDALVISRDNERPRVFLLEGGDTALKTLLETLNEGATLVGPDGTILYANTCFAELIDRPLAKALGAPLSEFLVPEDAAVLADLLGGQRDSNKREGGGGKRESALVRADGSRVPVRLSICAVDGDAAACTVVVTDLSALKAAELALRRANDDLEARVRTRTAELEQANAALRTEIAERTRLTEELRSTAHELVVADRRKDEFLALLAHELRNPLSPILTATEMMRLTGGADPSLERYRSVIERQARNLTRLVDDLLDVSRITRRKITLQKQPVELRTVVDNAVEATRPIIDGSDHRLEVRLPARPILLFADPTRFEQVLVNLLNNAAKYTEPGGRITLSAEVFGSELTLRVRDTGVGIAPELLPHIFDLFVQGKRSLARSQGGLGIGLTLVKNLVEMHGGTVAVSSDGAGTGTEMTVRMPLRPESADSPPASAAPPAGRVDRNGADGQHPDRRVLVVEDNPDVADGIVDLLQVWGYQVKVATDGEAALHAAEIFHPYAVIVDVGLPGIDGFEVARRLRRCAAPGERLLLIGASGYGQAQDRRMGAEAGFDHYLVKPVSMDLVRELLERPIHDRSEAAPEHPAGKGNSAS